MLTDLPATAEELILAGAPSLGGEPAVFCLTARLGRVRGGGFPVGRSSGFLMMQGKTIHAAQQLSTLSELLQQRAAQHADRTAFIFHDEPIAGQSELEATLCWTYAELDQRARSIGAWLSQNAEMGDRALLVYAPGLDFIAAYFGCIYAGVLPVPATYPKPRRPLPRLATMARDCKPRLVLTSRNTLSTIRLDEQEPVISEIPWQTTDAIGSAPSDWQPVNTTHEDLAFLQYTSGSTTEPRGVMVSHRNLLHNLEMIRRGFDIPQAGTTDEITKGVFWLPSYHDMGLIGGILTPIYVGGTSHLLSPTTFLRRPICWLEAIASTGATISGAPNFAYEMCVAKIKPADRASLDLQNWRLAFCGAEPINAATLQEFADAFAPAGFRSDAFYPCYGLAESTLLVSGTHGPGKPHVLDIDRASLAKHRIELVDPSHSHRQQVVGCGYSLNSQELRIVDPNTFEQHREGAVGEIWVRGDSVARGYWQQDALTEEVFAARPAGGDALSPLQSGASPQSGAFLRTGDLGFQHDGQLYVTGRLKDMIILRGRNHYPQDIERTAQQAHEAVDLGAAFTTEGTDSRGRQQEQLVVIHQIHRQHRKADLDEVLRAIRRAIVEEHELDPQAIVLIRPVSLPRTSSGKVQRSLCRELFESSKLPIKAQWINQADDLSSKLSALPLTRPDFSAISRADDPEQLGKAIENWMLTWLADRAGLDLSDMQSSTPFAELGVDSLSAIELSQELEDALQLKIPPVAAWDYPTPRALSRYLAESYLAR